MPDQVLRVTIMVGEPDPDRPAWEEVSALGLSGAYGEDEPDYTLKMLKETNAKYTP